ncbi:MAG: ATP-dependent DNA helicase RecG [Clostridia bacterium]
MDAPLSSLKGVGPARLEALKAAGIDTVRQLLLSLPVDYRDLTQVRPLGSLRAGEQAAIEVFVKGPVTQRRASGLIITKARVSDGSDTMPAVWYNQPWLYAKLSGEAGPLLLYGKVEARTTGLQLTCPSFEQERGLIPVYRAIGGVSPKLFRHLVAQALAQDDAPWPDELPLDLRTSYGLCERNFAIRMAHSPASREALVAARRRLAFEELLLYQVAIWLMRVGTGPGIAICCDASSPRDFWRAMPFSPTRAQRKVLCEIASDLAADSAMARLVQGDVGCGKTAVAFGAMFLAAHAGFQSALMAPTEVLACQHYESAQALLEPLGISCGLLTGSLTPKAKRAAHEAIARGDWQVIIGTHALISESVAYARLGLVITDEQHRFGVKQRTALSQKGDSPNVLVMSATPIPRTLSLILYGDLDVSVIDELPPGRTPIKTRIVPEEKRAGLYGFLRSEVAAGRQAYIVCPLVEESEAMEARPAEKVYESLRTGPLQSLRVALAHGKMKGAQLNQVLTDFRQGAIDVLVATTVVEVGVNVPNASVMVIENAERFGLAQLHQLRGRVGRGAAASWCFLMAEPNPRLKLLTETSDGFLIAQKDMEYRGAGELFGFRQSGLTISGISSLAEDTRLLKETHDAARALFDSPDAPASKQVFALAKETFEKRLCEIAMN